MMISKRDLKCDAVSIASWLIQIKTPVNKNAKPVTLYLPNHIHNHHGDGFCLHNRTFYISTGLLSRKCWELYLRYFFLAILIKFTNEKQRKSQEEQHD
jgi:hypothetical protein